MKKPFLVRIELEFAVMAESKEDALEFEDFNDAVMSALQSNYATVDLLDRIPEGWDGDCLLWNSDKDIKLKEILEKE